MKRITSLLALLMLFFVGTPTNAQTLVVDEEADNLIEDASWITSPYSDADEGKSFEAMLDGNTSTFWHSNWHNGNAEKGTHYFQVSVPELPENFGFMYTRRPVAGDQTTVWSVYGVDSDKLDCSKDECQLLAIVNTPIGSNNSETLFSQPIQSQGYTVIRFYSEETGKFNSGGGEGRGYFHVAEFAILPCTEIDDVEAATNELQTVYTQYQGYAGAFNAGTEPGDYDPEKVAAFEKLLEDIANAIDGPDAGTKTAAELREYAAQIVTYYEALVASRIPWPTFENGYYFVKAALDYTQNVVIKEATEETIDPETGETIPGEPAVTETQHMIKGLYDNKGVASWKNIDETDCTFLWKMTYDAETGGYIMQNAAYDRYIGTIATSTAVTMSADLDPIESEIYVTFNDKDERGYIVALGHKGASGTTFLHQNNHGGGAGISSNCVGWDATAGASNWYFNKVDDEVAAQLIEAFAPYRDQTLIASKVNEMITTANAAIKVAKDVYTTIDSENPVITDATQFYSPMTTTDAQSENGVGIEIDHVYTYLLDGKTSTYWHSAWEGGNRPAGADYLQVNVADANLTTAAAVMTRRPVVNDHPTVMSVYGYTENDQEADDENKIAKDAGTLLGTFTIGYTNNTETKTIGVFDATGYPYLRFYAEDCTPTCRGYWHCSEFQIYPATSGTYNTKTQYAVMGNIATDLEAQIALCPATADEITPEYYNALKAVYDKFMAIYSDPAQLRATIASGTTTSGQVTIGTDPGYWTGDATTALTNAINAAKAYDENAAYTPENTQKHIDTITELAEGIYGSANKVQEGKWYYLRFGSEEECEARGGKGIGTGATNSDGVVTSLDLYNKYVTLASVTWADDAMVVEPLLAEEVGLGCHIAFDEDGNITDDDNRKFRFINVADTAYMIQHKSTGLYLNAPGGSKANLSVQPTLFNVRALGMGTNLITGRHLNGATYQHCNLHAEQATNKLVTWEANSINSRSALYIEDAKEDVAGNYNPTEVNMVTEVGVFQPCCYPVSLEITEGSDAQMYTASIGEVTAENECVVSLYPINKAEAGMPFIIVYGSTEDYNATEYTTELTTLIKGTELVKEPLTHLSLVGNFYGDTAPKGSVTCSGENYFSIAKSNANIGGNQCYIAAELQLNDAYKWPTLTFTLSEEDNIQSTIATVSKVGGIYTLDGKFVGKGNINSLKNMGRGIYVVNGVKVAVK